MLQHGAASRLQLAGWPTATSRKKRMRAVTTPAVAANGSADQQPSGRTKRTCAPRVSAHSLPVSFLVSVVRASGGEHELEFSADVADIFLDVKPSVVQCL